MRMRFRILAVMLLACTLGVPSSTVAQVTSTGIVEVVVTDSDGGVIPGATVVVAAADTVTSRTAVTNADGRARIDGLAPSAIYTVSVELQGFRPAKFERILVRSGQVTTIPTQLTVGGVTETVQVVAVTPLIDINRATTGQDITLELTESLPTGRSYQSYLQLVPGVLPDNPTTGGNPAVRSGMNYSDIARTLGDNVGVSTDNVYYIDGLNVTDNVLGTFGANLNTEIIQEQKVITGAIPAEYVGAAGLISNVITKSGSNRFSGSANYFFQNSNLVANNKHGSNDEFGTKDTAFTFGGPIARNRAWFYGSFRYLNRGDDVSALDTGALLRQVDRTDKQGFAKGTYNVSSSDVVAFTYLSDPTDITGSRDRNVVNAQDRSRRQGGHRFTGEYTRIWGNTLFEGAANLHNAELTNLSRIREPENVIRFRGPDSRTLTDESLGGYGRDLPEDRNNRRGRAVVTHTRANHTLKGGFEYAKNINFRDTLYLGNPAARWESIALRYGAVTANDISQNNWSGLAFDVTNPSDFGGFIDTINRHPNRASFYAAYDINGDGTISPAELGQRLVFNSTAGNPNGQLNYDRTLQATLGPQETTSRGLSFFVQDEFRLNKMTLNLGLRTEQWAHFATTGDNIYTFDWAFAPRLSAVYDLLGDGRQRVTGYYGRYYDPIRNDMTNFAGTLTGTVLEEQVFANGQWVTYRTRGGATVQDAFFSPTTKTPYTDDLSFGYARDLGNNQTFEATYFKRWTRNILEDYDLHLYADPTGYASADGTPGNINAPDSLYLGLNYFGYNSVPDSNFVIGTLAGGKRDFQGLEFVYRRRFANRWQAIASYNWNDGQGNTNSDGNADFQGDVLFLDPRAPNQYGTQPGLISHLAKGSASYQFPNGLQIGGTFGWNSGVHTSRTFRASSRNLPIRVPSGAGYAFGGTTQRWIAPDTVGAFQNPSYATFDLRLQYNKRISNVNYEFFVDTFNLFNAQSTILQNDLVAGLGTIPFGGDVQWVLPRRAFIGARVRF